MRRIGRIIFILFFLMLAAWETPALAQTNYYEGKTVRIIVGLAAGGGDKRFQPFQTFQSFHWSKTQLDTWNNWNVWNIRLNKFNRIET